jgi:hypothetical protein
MEEEKSDFEGGFIYWLFPCIYSEIYLFIY